MASTFTVSGVLFPIKVKLVSRKTLATKIRDNAGHITNGMYDTETNIIYVIKTLSEEELLHTLVHELVHAMEYQTSGQEEESRVDAIAAWLVKFAKFTSWRQILDGAK